MSNKLTSSKGISLILALSLAVCVFIGSNPVYAQQENRATAHVYGLVGLAFGQTAQLSVVNTHPPDPIIPSEQITQVEVEMKFFDGQGNLLAQNRARLLPGQSANLQLNFMPRDGLRLNVRPVVIVHHPQGSFSPKLVPSTLELFDSDSGKSSLFVNPATLVGFNPQPEPPAIK